MFPIIFASALLIAAAFHGRIWVPVWGVKRLRVRLRALPDSEREAFAGAWATRLALFQAAVFFIFVAAILATGLMDDAWEDVWRQEWPLLLLILGAPFLAFLGWRSWFSMQSKQALSSAA